MTGSLSVNLKQLNALALAPDEADDAHSAAVERLVQAIVKTALRRTARLDLDGAATLLALMEATSRIAISLPANDPTTIAAAIGEQLSCQIAARLGGYPPGPLDVPVRGTRQ